MDIFLKIFAGIALIIGVSACFAGYKFVKAARPAVSFLAGASIGVVIGVELNNIVIGILSILVLGAALAAPSLVSDKVGNFINVAFFSAVAAYIISSENIIAAVSAAVVFAILAIFFDKAVIIITSAVFGAVVTLISIIYIITPFESLKSFFGGEFRESIIFIALFALILAGGILCQIFTNKSIKKAAVNYDVQYEEYGAAQTFSERKYPGMQRAYRNFCIECGSEMLGTQRCPKCGFSFDD